MRFGYGYHHDHDWTAFGFVMPLLWLVFLAAVVFVVLRMVRTGSFRTPHPVGAAHETPEEILDRRFASGEIDAEAHAAAREHLKDHPR